MARGQQHRMGPKPLHNPKVGPEPNLHPGRLDSLRGCCVGRTRGSPELLERQVVLSTSCRGWTLGDADMASGERLPLGIRSWLRNNQRSNIVYCGYATKYGHTEVLQWLQANGHGWGDWTCAYAAEGKQLKILQWLHASGCPVDERTCAWAAVHGHIDVLVGICDGRRNRMRGVDVRVRPLLQRGI